MPQLSWLAGWSELTVAAAGTRRQIRRALQPDLQQRTAARPSIVRTWKSQSPQLAASEEMLEAGHRPTTEARAGFASAARPWELSEQGRSLEP